MTWKVFTAGGGFAADGTMSVEVMAYECQAACGDVMFKDVHGEVVCMFARGHWHSVHRAVVPGKDQSETSPEAPPEFEDDQARPEAEKS
ncbi:MAG: hypothetical protein GF355_09490 [Candidatus Eisenbacteria bacterium]|nr:hypothetical protein [Candidatus Eisenbacteria bacterium]